MRQARLRGTIRARAKSILTRRASPGAIPSCAKLCRFAIDRKALAAGVYGNTAISSRTMFPEYGAMKPFNEAIVNATYGVPPSADIPKAKGLIQSEGYSPEGNFYKKNG